MLELKRRGSLGSGVSTYPSCLRFQHEKTNMTGEELCCNVTLRLFGMNDLSSKPLGLCRCRQTRQSGSLSDKEKDRIHPSTRRGSGNAMLGSRRIRHSLACPILISWNSRCYLCPRSQWSVLLLRVRQFLPHLRLSVSPANPAGGVFTVSKVAKRCECTG